MYILAGCDNIHDLTSLKQYTLAIDVTLWNGFFFSAQYTRFTIASGSNLYQLTIGGYSGNTSDGFTDHDGSAWSTYDRDNSGHNCVSFYKGPWWYSNSSSFCYHINLNNIYWANSICPNSYPSDRCVTLTKLQNIGPPIKSTTMKIRAFS